MAESALEMEQQEAVDMDQFIQEKAARMERPMAGESLTSDPDTPWAWEQPPTYTDRTDALEYFFAKFVDEDVYPNLMELVGQRFPIMDIVKIFLVEAFEDGIINPDMVLLLAEPLAYMIMALAERADIDFVIDDDDATDRRTTDEMDMGVLDSALGNMKTVEKDEEFPEDLDQRIQTQELPQPSLLGER